MRKTSYKRKRYYHSSPQSFQSFLEDMFVRILQFGVALILLVLMPYYIKIIEYYFWFVDYVIRNPYILIPITIVVMVVFWVLIKFQKYRKQKRYMALQRFNEIMKLDWREFETFIASVLEEKWFHSILWAGIKDWWVDVTAIYDEQKYFVQCKHYETDLIWVEKIRELHGVMNGENPPAGWIFVTTTWFTSDAVSEAKKYGIELWDRNYLKKLVESREIIHDTSNSNYGLCERCWWELVLRVAKNWEHSWEQFLGCANYPKCTFIKQL